MNIRKILVSQPQPVNGKSPYFDIAEKYQVEVVFRPFIRVESISSKDFRQQRVPLAEFTAVIFTAKTAIDHFFQICEEMRVTVPETMKYFCTTESIALYLQKYIVYRKRKIFFGKSGKVNDLIPFINKHHTEKFIVPTSDVHIDESTQVLDTLKIEYTKAAMYRTVSNDFTPDEAFDYDMLIFFSPNGINSLLKNFPNFVQGDICIGAFGASTAKSVTEAGLRLDVDAPRPEAPSMTAALELFLKEKLKNRTK